MSKPTSSKKTSVLLVDDHPLLRRGLAQLINQQADLTVCGEAEDAATAVKLAESLQPDVAIVDITLRDRSGIELIKDLRIRTPKTLVLVLSMHDEAIYAERVLRAGARGYVTKGESPLRVIEGIRHLLDGKVFLSDKMASSMLQKIVGSSSLAPAKWGVNALSDRELEVLEMIGRGFPNDEIAQRLHLSVKTIDAHRENIKRKLKLSDASELRKYAISWVQAQQDG